MDWIDCLTDDVRYQVISTRQIAKLSSKLGNMWEPVAFLLGYSCVNIEQWKQSNPHNAQSWVMEMLSAWIRRDTKQATVGHLIEVFKEAGINDENVYRCLI